MVIRPYKVWVLSGLAVLHPFPQPVLLFHHPLRQSGTNAHKDERGPLPAERVDDNDENEPVHKFRVREEFERTRRRSLLHESSKINPQLHQTLVGPAQWVHEEHEQEARVDADVVVADGADGVDIRAVVGTDVHVARREDLQVPRRRLVVLLEAVVRQEAQARPLVARRHDAQVALDVLLLAGAAFRDALRAVLEHDAGLGEMQDVAAEPVGAAGAHGVEDAGIYHGGFGEDAFAAARRGCEVREIAVKEDAEKRLGDPTEDCFGAEDVERKNDVDDRIAWDDPSASLWLVASRGRD